MGDSKVISVVPKSNGGHKHSHSKHGKSHRKSRGSRSHSSSPLPKHRHSLHQKKTPEASPDSQSRHSKHSKHSARGSHSRHSKHGHHKHSGSRSGSIMVEDALPPLEEKVIQRLAENPLDWLDPAFAHEPGMIGYIWHHFCHHHNDYMDHSEVHKLAKACRLRFQEEFKAAIRKEQGELVEEDVVEEIYRKDKDQFLEGETEHDEVKTIEKFLFREINQGQTHTHHTIKKLAFYEHWALAAEKLFTIETNNSLNIGCCVIA